MNKRKTWILLLKCQQTPCECLIFMRLTQKIVIADLFSNFFFFLEMIFNDFVDYDR